MPDEGGGVKKFFKINKGGLGSNEFQPTHRFPSMITKQGNGPTSRNETYFRHEATSGRGSKHGDLKIAMDQNRYYTEWIKIHFHHHLLYLLDFSVGRHDISYKYDQCRPVDMGRYRSIHIAGTSWTHDGHEQNPVDWSHRGSADMIWNRIRILIRRVSWSYK